jgi:hypothetical protein
MNFKQYNDALIGNELIFHFTVKDVNIIILIYTMIRDRYMMLEQKNDILLTSSCRVNDRVKD